MHVITGSGVLFLWMHMLTLVKSEDKDCTLQQFVNGPLFDANFDITDLNANYAPGKQVRVSCNIGYSGFFKLICVEGTWQSRGDPCKPKSCGHPGDAQFADFHLEKGDDFVFGSQVVYTCQKGYQMVSRINYRRCMAQGWDGLVPVCEAQQCPVIHVANNVQVIGDPEEATYGNVVRFSCKSNTEILTGSKEMYCDENGEWNGEPPVCNEIKCEVPKIENGYVLGDTQEYKENEVLHFRCNPSYKAFEARPSKCIKQGSRADWAPTPLCELITCKLALPALQGTSYEPAFKSVFIPGEVVRVTCGEKYWISHQQDTSAVITCKEDGQWSLSPVCLEVTCPSQRPSRVSYWDIRWGQRVRMDETTTYSCRTGYRRTGGASQAKCTRDGWTPDPLCEAITCKTQSYEDAEIDGIDLQEYRYKEKVKYNCKAGYEGQFTLTCWDSGWIGTHQCARKRCEKLNIENAQIIRNRKQAYIYNEKVSYACKNNHERVFTITCGESGWTGIQNCSACVEPDIPHGFAVSPHNDTLYYTCKDGYKLSTKGWWAKATCNDGMWSGLEQCIENTTCGDLPVIPNGRVVPSRGQVEGGRIICDEGYSAEATHLTCRDGKWYSNGFLPKTICTPTADPCDPPRKVQNAVVETPYQKKYLSGSTITFRCREKYATVEGEDMIMCQNGTWTKNEIKCTPYCDKLEDVKMTFTLDRERYMDGDSIKYKCVTSDVEGIATCVNTMWNKSEECEVKPCQLPDDTPNGYYQIIHGEEFVFGTTVKYFCNEGYQMISRQDTRTCLLDKWTNHVPVCEPFSCVPPPTDEGVTVKGLPDNDNPILPDRFLTFSCDVPGKYLNGSSMLICGKDGQWNHPFPSCEDIICELEMLQPHLHVVGLPPENETMKIGHKLRFHCDYQYTFEGSKEIECLQTGKWNSAFPTCAGMCKVTGLSGSVRLTRHVPRNQLRKGQKLSFECMNSGHALRGSSVIECLGDGQWSDAFPTCGAPLGCGAPPPLADGDIKYSLEYQYVNRARVEYVCQPYYTMEGEPFKTCFDGKWTGQMRCLKPCTVDQQAMDLHNIEFTHRDDPKLYSVHNDRIRFSCKRHRTPVGTVSFYQTCNDGVMHLPTCH